MSSVFALGFADGAYGGTATAHSWRFLWATSVFTVNTANPGVEQSDLGILVVPLVEYSGERIIAGVARILGTPAATVSNKPLLASTKFMQQPNDWLVGLEHG